MANCSYYNDTDHTVVAAALRAGTGVFSALCCLTVIVVILRSKKYSSFSQRLVLYLAIAALLHSLSYSLARVNYYTPRSIYDDYCYFGAFATLYFGWVEVLALSCLSLNLLLYAVRDQWMSSWFQYVYLLVMYLLPLLWCWVPFIDHTFGTTRGWCDMRIEDQNCQRFLLGYISRFVLWYGPVFLVMLICFIATIIAALLIHRRMKIWSKIYNPQQQPNNLSKKLKNEVLPLTWYPIVYLFLQVFSLVNAIDVAVNQDDNTEVFWYLHVLTSPLRGAFIAVVYAVDSGTRKQISPGHIYSLLCRSCKAETPASTREALDSKTTTDSATTSLVAFEWKNKYGATAQSVE